MTILWTFGSFDAAFNTETVPATAGLMKSSGFSTFQWNGDAVCMIALRVSVMVHNGRRTRLQSPPHQRRCPDGERDITEE